MDKNACETCDANIEINIDEDVRSFLDYAAYIYRKLEKIEMNMPVKYVGMESRHVLVVKRVRDDMREKITRRQRQKQKKEN